LLRALARTGLLGALLLLCGCTQRAANDGAHHGSVGQDITPTATASVWQYSDPSFQPLAVARALSGRLRNALYEIEVPDN